MKDFVIIPPHNLGKKIFNGNGYEIINGIVDENTGYWLVGELEFFMRLPAKTSDGRWVKIDRKINSYEHLKWDLILPIIQEKSENGLLAHSDIENAPIESILQVCGVLVPMGQGVLGVKPEYMISAPKKLEVIDIDPVKASHEDPIGKLGESENG